MKNQSLEQWLQNAAGGGKTDPKAVQRAIQTGDASKLAASLSPSDLEKVKAVLNDKQKMQEILNSPMGRQFMNRIQK